MGDDETLSIILSSVDAFMKRRLPPEEIRRRDENHLPPYDLVPELAEMGLLRAPIAEAHGGLGLPWTSMCRIQERNASHAFFVCSIINRFICFGALPIIAFGSQTQKQEILPRVLAGRTLVALALTEPGAGSDARAVAMRARKVDGGWRLTGRKTWISDADHAELLLTLCRTPAPDGGDQPSYTAFLAPRRAEGVAMTPLAKVGNHCMPSFDIGYDDVFVPGELVLGPVGQGFQTIAGTLKYSRAGVASGVIGTAQAAFDLARAHAIGRVQFGQPVAAFQAIRHRLVDMHVEIVKARLMVRELARLIDAGEAAEEMSSMTKAVATDMLQFVTHHGMQIMASAGYAAESPMQRYWRDARLYTFGEGSNEIQKDIIARSLGLPTQGRARRDMA
ncbi:MAG: acyl-CoA/acyl-ACP dehydrogenase [Methylobacteriaceae bacterium]|nr:acyl-CoA/acyl-ACP dehydrogenase [Methylobacteriaceae bacterium]